MMENFADLLELLERKDEVIAQQGKIIAKLVNETVEKENYIQVMIED